MEILQKSCAIVIHITVNYGNTRTILCLGMKKNARKKLLDLAKKAVEVAIEKNEDSWKKAFVAIPTESIIRDYQEKYYEVLELSGNVGESTPFVEFMLEVILKSIESSVKSSVNTEDKIMELIKQNPKITIAKIAEALSISTRAVEKQLAKLKNENKLQRIGSARKGEWRAINAG